MASQPSTTQKSSSRWGSFLANVESRLDTILADEDTTSKSAGKGETKAQEPLGKKDGVAVPGGSSASQSRTSSTTRAQDRLNEKLARAMANRNLAKKTESSPTPSSVPSRTASPANGPETPRDGAEVQIHAAITETTPQSNHDASGTGSNTPNAVNREDEVQDEKQKEAPEGGDRAEPSVLPLPNPSTTHLQDEPATGRISLDSQGSASMRHSADIPRLSEDPVIPDSPKVNGVDPAKPSKSSEEYESEITQLRSDNEASELRRQDEIRDYLERIDALQAKLNYLTREAAEAAKNALADVKSGSLEQKVAEKDEKIALLIEEGQKLSQTELKHMSIIKKLRAKSGEDDRTVAETKKTAEKHQKVAKDAQERAKKAEVTERQAAEKIKNAGRVERELEQLKQEKASNENLIRDLQLQLATATSAAREAEERARAEALEQERKRAADLADELSNLKIEKELAEKSYQSDLREWREKSEREKERARIAEIERQAEQDALESRLETYRARAEEASAGQGGDVHAKLLRQVETLQNQYAVASENWQGIEGSLLSRVTVLEKEKDESARRESDIRRKAREANIKGRRLEEDVERANTRISDLDNELSSKSSQLTILHDRLSNAEAEVVSARKDSKAEREAWEVQLANRLEEERVKMREEIVRNTPDPQHFRTDSPVLRTRKSSINERASPAHNRRRPSHQTLPALAITSNGHPPMERSLSRHSSEKRVASAATDFPPPFRTDSMSTIPQLSVNNGVPETPTFSNSKDEEGYFDDLATPATPERTINDLISVSTAGAGPSVQLVERMSAAVRRLESEKAAHKDELSRLAVQRDEAREQVVELMRDNDGKKASDKKVQRLEKELNEVKERYMTTLEMLGEKSERVEELKADVDDLKGMYRELVERTTQ